MNDGPSKSMNSVTHIPQTACGYQLHQLHETKSFLKSLSFLARHNIYCHLRTLNLQNSQLLVSIRSQMNPVHILLPYFFLLLQFNIIIQSMPGFPRRYFYFTLPNYKLLCISHLFHKSYISFISSFTLILTF
jgi:hypothetical protein